MPRLLVALVLTTIASWLGGCGDSAAPSTSASCTPGAAMACVCNGGVASHMICTSARTFGPCGCGDAGVALPDGPVDARGDASPSDAGDGAPSRDASDAAAPVGVPDAAVDAPPLAPAHTSCVAPGKLSSGSTRLIDLYVTDAGVIIVRPDAILLVGRDRAIKKMITPTRLLTTSSFDGTYLAVADSAKLNVFDAKLDLLGDVALVEACASSAIVNNGVFVCGPSNDWDRVFYTYDLKTRALLRASKKYTYHGIPMRPIPETNHFITVTTGSSPSDFYLHRVEANGDTVYMNESPYHGGFAATMTFAYAGRPVTHVVNMDGLLLRVFGEGCTEQANSFTSRCFVKDGNLGTLWMGERFAALANDASGQLFAMTTDAQSYGDALCAKGCSAQVIDVAQRKVLFQKKHTIAARRFVALAPDPGCKAVVVGYEVAVPGAFDSAMHQVDILDYGAP